MLASTFRLSRAVPRVPVGVLVRRYAAATPPAPPAPPAPTPPPPPLPAAPPTPTSPALPGLEYLSPVWTRLTNLIIDKAEGSWIYATDGKKYLQSCKKYLDFVAGTAVVSAGHCHPKILKAASEQMGKLVHGQMNVAVHKPVLALMNRMKDFVKLSENDKYFFANSGDEANEAAIKLARHATGKTNIITFEGSFHGRTIGTMSMSNSKTIFRRGYQPLMPGVFVAPYPIGEMTMHAVHGALRSLRRCSKCKQIIIEPILGEGGYVPAPAAFIKGLRKLCDEHNILLIFDEIQSGIGRTGKWFAFQHYDITPDILTFGDGIANGLPLSGIIAREELHKKWVPGSHGGTFNGNPVSCAAALATIEYLKADYMLENAQRRGVQLTSALERLKVKYPFAIGEVRNKGLMVAVEFTDKVAKGTADCILQFALSHGLILMTAGAFEVIRFMPPLTITEEEMKMGINWFEKSVDAVLGTKF